MRIRPLALICLTISLLGSSALAQQQTAADDPSNDSPHELYELGRFAVIYQRILGNYVDRPDPEKLIKAAIDGMVNSLDPHSRYVDAKAFQDMRRQLTGKFAGLGVEVVLDHDAIVVKRALPDSPAARAGLLAGDVVLRLDNMSVQGMSLDDVLQRMNGVVGSTAKLSIRREGRPQALDFSVTRAILEMPTVEFEKIGSDVGYMRISEFDDNTFASFQQAIGGAQADIGSDRFKGFVIDLRNNPGGLLEQAISVSAGFVGRGVVVSVRGRASNLTKVFIADGVDLSGGKPLIVLINGGTASAAEIMAGALQDLGRATILGTRSYGKGSVQTVSRLADQSALILTTARYYTPLGRSIQAVGIRPDILVLQRDAVASSDPQLTSGEADLPGHLKAAGGTEGSGSSLYVPRAVKDDTQLNAALDLLRGQRQDPAFPSRRTAP